MSAPNKIPELADIDTQFFTSILRAAGLSSAAVESFTQDVVGTGQMGKCVRFDLQASSDSCDIPKSLIGKFPSDDAGSLQSAADNDSYVREVYFYKELEPLLSIQVPKCFYAEMAEDGLGFALIMEDMAPAEQGNQLAGCTPHIAEIAVKELVGLHASTWNNQALFDRSPMLVLEQARIELILDLYSRCLPAFKEKFGGKLSVEQLDIFEQVADPTNPVFSTDLPYCSIVHNDYRLDNFLLQPDPENPCLTVVDWQTYALGRPLNDVAYVLATSLSVEERRSHEERIVRSYHEGLLASGVKDFGWEDCWLEYRKSSAFGFLIALTASVTVKQTDRGDAMFLLMADRMSHHALDLKADELLG